MLALLWFHVAAMFTAFALLPTSGLVLKAICDRSDAATARVAARAMAPLAKIGVISVTLGIVAGLILARSFGYGSHWLIWAYILGALTAVFGAGINGPWAERIARCDDATFQQIRNERLKAITTPVEFVLWFALIWLMIAKPA